MKKFSTENWEEIRNKSGRIDPDWKDGKAEVGQETYHFLQGLNSQPIGETYNTMSTCYYERNKLNGLEYSIILY